MRNFGRYAWVFLFFFVIAGGCKEENKEEGPKEDGWVILGAKVKASDLETKSTNIASALKGEKGDAVVVSGTIGEICLRGCWFYLQDDKDTVYVNVLGSLEVPQDAKGKKAVVKATVEGSGGGKSLEATTVLIEE